MRRPTGLLSSVGLLTRWPVDHAGNATSGTAWFPMIGALIGLAGGAVYAVSLLALPRVLSATIAVAAVIALTGALHEDGLADYADALGSRKGADEALEIMRDPRVGVFGATALILSIVWRIAALSTLGPGQALALLPMAHSMARSATAALVGASQARSEGVGHFAADTTTSRGVVVSMLGGLVVGVLAAGYWAVPAALLAGLAVLRLRSSARRRLGGVTGDVLGTCEQTVEILILTMGVIVVDIDTPLWTGFL